MNEPISLAIRGPYEHARPLNEAVAETAVLLEQMRRTKKVPLDSIRQNVIPVLREIVDRYTRLFPLLTVLMGKGGDYGSRHPVAVAILSTLIGKWIGLKQQDLLQLMTAAYLHDVGKTMIPTEILDKKDKLTAEEFNLLKNHTIYGYERLRETVGLTHRQALVALQHHERLDGSGYPFGLKHDKIELFSRIVAVADVFHAMCSVRLHREPMSFHDVLRQMENDSFGALDPVITNRFIELLMQAFIGQSVILTNGKEGTLLMINRHDPVRPLIRTKDGFLDLSRTPSINIVQIGDAPANV